MTVGTGLLDPWIIDTSSTHDFVAVIGGSDHGYVVTYTVNEPRRLTGGITTLVGTNEGSLVRNNLSSHSANHLLLFLFHVTVNIMYWFFQRASLISIFLIFG